MTPDRVPVLIAGAGPVGLSLAIELAYRGVRCLVVEQTDGEAAKNVGAPLEVIALDESQVRETYERRFVLVRPNGHVAWRGDAIPKDAAQIIDRVRGASL